MLSLQFNLSRKNPLVCGHTVGGHAVLPGLAYCDLILQLFRKHGHPWTELALRKLTIYAPLIADDGVLVQVRADEDGPDRWKVRVEACPTTDGAGQAVLHATAQVDWAGPAAFDEKFDIAAIVASARKVTDFKEVYERCRRMRLVHSGAMVVEGRIYQLDSGLLLDLTLAHEAGADASTFLVHPALLDGSAVGASLGFCSLDSEPGLYLPLCFDSFRARAALTERCFTWIPNASLRRNKDLLYLAMEFFDSAGNKIAELANLASKLAREHPVAASLVPPGPSSSPADGFVILLRELVAHKLGSVPDRIDTRTGYHELGLDSVGLLKIVGELEATFAASLPPTLLFEHTTIEELATWLKLRFPGQAGAWQSRDAAVRACAGGRSGPDRRDPPPAPGLAIVGLAGRYPQAYDLDAFWRVLRSGQDCVSAIPEARWDWRAYYSADRHEPGKTCSKWGGFIEDAEFFDASFFNISPREALLMDPLERLFLEHCWIAIEDAGYTPEQLNRMNGQPSRVGVYAGVMFQEYALFAAEALARGRPLGLASGGAGIANRVSYFCNFRGASMVVDTACSSSLTALYLAGRALRAGEIDAALVGGVNLSIHPNKYLALGAGQFLSSKGRCEAFGEGADGYVPGEGVGVLLLKRLDDAVRDGDHVYGVIKGTAIGHGGKTSGFTVPSPQAQHIVIAAALEEAGIEPRTVSYVEAHGTGTKLGDPIEIAGLAAAFEQVTDERQFCAVGSVKPNIGHCEAAAGIAGITKVLLQMQHREIVPSLHSRPPNPHIDLASTAFYVNDELRHWPRPLRDGREAPRRAGVSSFGAGGSNAHVVIEEHSGEPAAADVRPALIPLSAKSEEQLRAYAQELVSFLQRSRERRGVEPVARPCARRVQDVLIEAAARLLNLPADQIVPTGNLAAQGFDAVALAHLMQDVEQSFDLTLDPSLFYQQPSLAALASELCHSHGAALDARLTDDDGSNSAPDFPSLEDIAYTLQVGRVAFSERLAVVVSDIDQLEKQLQQFLDETPSPFAYRGSVKSGEAERSRQLVEGEVGAEFIAAVARSRQLNKLAHLWVTGVAVDWALLYPERHPVRVSLPTYPFARQRYWIADVLGSPTAQPAPHSTDESESPDSPLSRPAWGPLQREDSSQHVMLAASDGNGSPSAAQPAQSVAASGGAAGSLNGRQAPSGNGAAAPRNEFEAKIADAWQEVLGLPHVGIRDNFLELGGSSLGVTQIISRLRKAFPFELDLSNFFGAATVAEMAEMLEEEIIRRIRELPGEDITGAIDDATGAGARPRE